MWRAALLPALLPPLCAPAAAAAKGDCASCDLVPCWQCQEGCDGSTAGCASGGSRNMCPDGNKGEHPMTCLMPPAPTKGGSFCAEAGWRQVWADEFSGGALDNSSWNVDLGSYDSLVRESQGTADNVYLEGGKLVLRSQRQTVGNWQYTSGAVETKGKHAWKGRTRVCVRAQLPGGGGGGAGDGLWPAHWMMPDNGACWPSNGEIDFMEMVDGDGVAHGTYHWKSDGCSDPHREDGLTQTVSDFSSAYHEYAVEYDGRGYVAFALDGQGYINVTGADYWNVPFYLILNTAIGGPWPKPPSSSTAFPAYHRIDYVRVAQPL